MHPYKKADGIDQYYLRLANRIQEVFLNSETMIFLDEKHSALTAARLAAWFEDVISQTGIWQAFTTECKSRYGDFLPLIETGEDYFQDEINVEDIQYQLWHYCQCAKLDQMIMDPWSEPFVELSAKVYEILSAEYESAPENPRLQEFLTRSYDKNAFYEFRSLAQWFHYDCYFNAENTQDLDKETQDFSQIDPEESEMFAFSDMVNHIFLSNRSPLALTTQEWMQRIVKAEPLKSIFDHLEARPYASYLIQEVTDDAVTVIPFHSDDKAPLKIRRDSINTGKYSDHLKPGQFIHSALVFYEGIYWLNGALAFSDAPEQAKKEATGNESQMKDMSREDFLSYTGGKSYLFFQGGREASQFLRANFPEVGPNLLRNIAQSKTANCLTYSSVVKLICFGNAECLKHPDNAFYAPSEPDQSYIFLFLLPKNCPYDLSLQFLEDGLLDDAKLVSFKGTPEQYKKHLRFMIDYFHGKYKG